jgi:hypothetical protein
MDVKTVWQDKPITFRMTEMLAQNYEEAQHRAKAYRYMAIINESIKKLKELQEKYWVNVLASDSSHMKLEDIPGFGYNYPFKCDISDLKDNWGEYPCFEHEVETKK